MSEAPLKGHVRMQGYVASKVHSLKPLFSMIGVMVVCEMSMKELHEASKQIHLSVWCTSTLAPKEPRSPLHSA